MQKNTRGKLWWVIALGGLVVCVSSLANDLHLIDLKEISTGQSRMVRTAMVLEVKRDRNLHTLEFYFFPKTRIEVIEV